MDSSFAKKVSDSMGASAPDEESDDGKGDQKAALKAALKSFFDAGKSGDMDAALDAFQTACGLCDSDDYGSDDDKGGDGHALLLVPHS